MKIIFLDIDGVLTTVTWRAWMHFNPVCVNLLKSILTASDYKLVISSTWRQMGLGEDSDLNTQLVNSKLKSFLYMPDWRTPKLNTRRGIEIKDWLNRHPEVTEYIILDDDSDFLDEQLPRFIKTSVYNGLMFEHYLDLQKLAGLQNSTLIKIPEFTGVG